MLKQIIASAGALAAVTLAGTAALAFETKTVFHRSDKLYDVDLKLKGQDALLNRIAEGREELAALTPERVGIMSDDGLKLVGWLYHPEEPSDHYMLCMHGYHSSVNDFVCAVPFFRSLGYHVLLAEQRAHGESEGNWITFGVKERYDCLAWTRYLVNTFGDSISIVLDGLSMGATTVQLASALPLPGSVKAVISDCGFTSPYDIVSDVLGRVVPKAAVNPVMAMLRPMVKRLAGFDLKAVSTEEALAHTDLPVLFVHGLADELVPHEMSVRGRRACRGPSELISVEGAGHGLSFIVDEPRCREACRAFLDRYDPRPGGETEREAAE